MKTKIEWYQEVLKIEPASKVFFQLARLLYETGRVEEATRALRQGLERHPEHLEAQFLLVEALGRLGRIHEAQDLARELSGRMSAYAGFWKAWARVLAQGANTRDPAMALNFLAAFFSDQRLSWGDVIEQGLIALGQAEGGRPVSAPRAAAPVETPAPRDEDTVSRRLPLEPSPPPGGRNLAAAVVALEKGDLPAGEEAESEEDAVPEVDEKAISYRTRTMAKLLAEQGDLEGALDILREILDTAEPAQRPQIEEQLRDLEHRLAQQGPSVSSEAQARSGRHARSGDSAEGLAPKKKLIDALEGLARRLEVRALG